MEVNRMTSSRRATSSAARTSLLDGRPIQERARRGLLRPDSLRCKRIFVALVIGVLLMVAFPFALLFSWLFSVD